MYVLGTFPTSQVLIPLIVCGFVARDGIVRHQEIPTGLPRIPGHEVIGDIVSVHPDVKSFEVGDRVGAGWHGGHCFSCRECLSGDYAVCRNRAITGEILKSDWSCPLHTMLIPFISFYCQGILVDGGYAEYATLRTESLVRVPKDLDPVQAAPLVCAGVTIFGEMSLQKLILRSGADACYSTNR